MTECQANHAAAIQCEITVLGYGNYLLWPKPTTQGTSPERLLDLAQREGLGLRISLHWGSNTHFSTFPGQFCISLTTTSFLQELAESFTSLNLLANAKIWCKCYKKFQVTPSSMQGKFQLFKLYLSYLRAFNPTKAPYNLECVDEAIKKKSGFHFPYNQVFIFIKPWQDWNEH